MDSSAHSLPWRHPLEAFASLRDTPYSLLLLGDGAQGRWSYILAHPRRASLHLAAEEALHWAQVQLETFETGASAPEAPPLRTGVAGLLGYDPGCPTAGPPSAVALYDLVLAFDHQTRTAWLQAAPGACPDRRAALLSGLAAPSPPPVGPNGRVADVEPRPNFGRKVEAVRARIACGEFYQANISRRFEGRLGPGDHPFDLFRRLARSSPAAFAAYVRLPGCAIVSNSPERLVRVQRTDAGRMALASPIKGTSPRGEDPLKDARNAEALLSSEKDRAENLMIVDLMRNDLSTACAPGTVRTPRLFELSTLPNVHHLVSHVEGRLRDDRSALDLLEACFPAGSITGAPKRQAMTAIREIEGSPRGADYGSIFWAGGDGELDASVLIRTATCREMTEGWSAAFRVGCGITSDSDPEAETLETEAKAQRLLQAICGAAT
ncbi:anthranilate synthase component I family protein [Phenylobacterium parvum]|uniref:Aminodeoxychorismate synthase component I n=1 Tax=Phenylobacterium parvum TaxID=2201350 RepID=A0A2Z3HQT7_9CAUL|nr:anthranilate synthase component I family protein [Phenylobacterium parvum]AWM77165.1 aminodeoxychorismate synthase component I [Phenylobacterium parvum]